MNNSTLSHRAWQFNLGLLPVPLYMGEDTERRHVMLNGVAGNFCLDEGADSPPIERATIAWSSNIGHHLVTNRDYVEVVRWDQPEKIERFTTSSVASNLEAFHRYLERKAPERLNSVVSHALGVYRALRSALRDGDSGFQSLAAFLFLIYQLELDDGENAADAAFVPEGGAQAFSSISSEDRDYFAERLSGRMGSFRMMRPDLTLLLRHASGALFQEAHAQVELPRETWLPGLGPTDALPLFNTSLANGAYFTPPSIARTLAEECIRETAWQTAESLSIFDPACGSGELLKECLRILELKGYRGKIFLQGWDISQAAASIATFSLGWEARAWNGRVVVEIRHVDSLLEEHWPAGVDVILMNPPFKSWQQMDEPQREAVTESLGSMQANKPNLASVFIERASQSLSDTGVLGSVAPRSFFEASSTKSLRGRIDETLSVRVLANLANTSLFQSAMVQSGVFVATKGKADNRTTVVWTDPQPGTAARALRGLRRFQLEQTLPISDDAFSVYKDPGITRNAKHWLARPYAAWELDQVLRNRAGFVSAKSLFDIHQGVRMGSDAFLIDSRVWKGLSIDEKRFFRPAVTNASLEAGRLEAKSYIFYPYSIGLPKIESEDALSELVPNFYETILLPNREALAARKSLVKASQPWWGLIWPREWQYEPAKKLVSKYFGKHGSFAWDANGDFVVVVGHGWIPRANAKLWQHLEAEEFSHCVIAILASKLSETLLAQCSVQVGGGQWDLSSKYVGELLLPAPSKANTLIIRDLASLGERLGQGDDVAMDLLEQLVSALYGVRYVG